MNTINLIEVAKTIFDNLTIQSIDTNKSLIGYKSKYKIAQPKYIVVPNVIELDEEFVEGIGLYIGDGKLSPNDQNHLDYITVDEDIAEFVWNFFQRRFYVNPKDVTFIIRYKEGNVDDLRTKWSKILDISENKFRIQNRNRYKSKDSITIQINSRILRILFKKVVEITLAKIKNDESLRQGFLRGEFAADGKFGIEKDTNTYYISEVTFCYDANKETWLRDYIIDCLKLEDVTKFHSIPGYIRITGWENYIKFWKIGLLDRCSRKKNKFLKVIKQMNVRLEIDRNRLQKLIANTNLSKESIRKELNLHRTNINRVLRVEQLLTLEQIDKLLQLSKSAWSEVLENINKIRIGRLTNLSPSHNFILFLLNEKDLNTSDPING